VRYFGGGATSESLVMRSRSGTVRKIHTQHHWQKIARISPTER
jgi:fructose-1,6-bisphosphatase II